MSNDLKKSLIISIIGGLIYSLIEILWRGYTHWSMFLVAALISIPLDQINERLEWEMPIWLQAIYGGIAITITELFAGIIFNIILGLNVWDYSHLPFNFLGQICLLYSFLWVLLAAVGIILFDFLRWKLFNERKPYYTLSPRRH